MTIAPIYYEYQNQLYGPWLPQTATTTSSSTSTTYNTYLYTYGSTSTTYDTYSCTYGSTSPYYYGSHTYGSYEIYETAPKSFVDRMRDILKSRQSPLIIVKRKNTIPQDKREVRARQTLRKLLGEKCYNLFLRNGFISVRGKSGLLYQIFPGHKMIAVYNKGQMTEKLCVVLSGDFPPTDSLIMRYLLVLSDEDELRRRANIHAAQAISNARFSQEQINNNLKPLSEIAKNIRLQLGAKSPCLPFETIAA